MAPHEPQPEREPEPQSEPEPEPEPERPVPRTPPIRHSLSITLGELFAGTVRRLALSRRVRCPDCSGSGTRAGREAVVCGECHGEGRISDEGGFGLPMGMMRGLGQRPCQACGGTGQLMEGRDKCRRCRGAKQVLERKVVEVNVAPGAGDRERIVVPEHSDQPVDGVGKPGDLVVTLSQRPHSCYSRRGDDLLLDLPIPLRTALCGGTCDIQTLDGERLRFECPAGLRPGDVRSIAGKGFPVKGSASPDGATVAAKQASRGRLLVRFAVKFPESIDRNAAIRLGEVLDNAGASAAGTVSPGEGASKPTIKDAPAGDVSPSAMVNQYSPGQREPLLAEQYGGIQLGFDSADALEGASVGELKGFLAKFGYSAARGLERPNLVTMAQRLFVAKAAEQAERRSQKENGDDATKKDAADCDDESRVEELPPTAAEIDATEAIRQACVAAPPVPVKLVAASDADRETAAPQDKAKASAQGAGRDYGQGAGFRSYGGGEFDEEGDYSGDESEGGQQQCSQQ
jgi:DnaJ-class molecular chaperone